VDDKPFRAYYEFDDNDLYLNRQGRLSDRQYKQLSTLEQDSRRFNRLGATVALVTAAALPCLILPISLLTLLNQNWTALVLAWVGSAAWLAVFGGAGLWLLRSARAANRTNWDVRTVQGQAGLTQVQRRSTGRYRRNYIVHFFTLGESSFELDDTLVGHVRDGDHLAVYCAGDQIVSLEQLPSRAA